MGGNARPADGASRLPAATVARLPVYLQVLRAAEERGDTTLASDDLARSTGLTPAMVRKDLSFLGSRGTRGVGYPVVDLASGIAGALGITDDDRAVVIVGIGNLGRALASYDGFSERGFRIGALVDADPAVVGSTVAGHEVAALAALPELVRERSITLGVVAVPAAHAAGVATALVDAGVGALLNFAPTHLDVPDGVTVRRVDLSSELQILSFYDRAALRRAVDDGVAAAG